MAKRASTRAVQVYRAPAQSAPVIKIAAPTPVKKRGGGRRRGGGGGGGGGADLGSATGPIVAGGILGVLKRTGMLEKIPAVPMIGRFGALAGLSYFWMRNGGGKLAKDIFTASAVVSAFQLGEKGEIDGEDGDGQA